MKELQQVLGHRELEEDSNEPLLEDESGSRRKPYKRVKVPGASVTAITAITSLVVIASVLSVTGFTPMGTAMDSNGQI